MKLEPLISEELAAFLGTGLSLVIATRDAELQPAGVGAWGARVEADRARLTVFLHRKAAKALLPNLEAHPEIALDFDRPTTHRACQVKGVVVSHRPAKPSERPLVERFAEGFRRELEELGIPRAMTDGWELWPCTALEVRVQHIFEQTPGPGTGEPLK